MRRYWCIPVITVVGVFVGFLGAVFRRRRESPLEQTQEEMRAIQTAATTKKLSLGIGASQARKVVEREYADTVLQLNAEQAEKAKELRDDPEELAKFLVRASNTDKQ